MPIHLPREALHEHLELVEQQRIVVPYVATDDNLADFFTKPLVAKKFFALRDKIMNNPFPSPSLEPGISSRGGVVESEPVPPSS